LQYVGNGTYWPRVDQAAPPVGAAKSLAQRARTWAQALGRRAPLLTRPRFWLIAAGVLAAYMAAGFLLVPRIVKAQILSQIETRYHRHAALGGVSFNPFTLELTLRDFYLPDADGKELLAFRRFHADLQLASLWRRGLVFHDISFEAPRLRLVRRADGRPNVLDLD
jgi:uncharacterized protein involved in outer membrane biogenesis